MAWAAARLHAGVRDAINNYQGAASDAPFKATPGQAISELERLAEREARSDQQAWISTSGRPALRRRNAVIHAVTYTANDGKQALGTVDHSRPRHFLTADLRNVTRDLIAASMTLPS